LGGRVCVLGIGWAVGCVFGNWLGGMASILGRRTRAQEDAYFSEESGDQLRRIRERMEREGRLPKSAEASPSPSSSELVQDVSVLGMSHPVVREAPMRRALRRGVQYGWPTARAPLNRVVHNVENAAPLDLSRSAGAVAAQSWQDLYRGRWTLSQQGFPTVPVPRHAHSARAKEAAERAMKVKAPAVMVAIKAFGIATGIVTGAAVAGIFAFQLSMGASNLTEACLTLADRMKPKREAALESLSPLRDRVKAFAAAQQMSSHDRANLETAFGGLKIDNNNGNNVPA